MKPSPQQKQPQNNELFGKANKFLEQIRQIYKPEYLKRIIEDRSDPGKTYRINQPRYFPTNNKKFSLQNKIEKTATEQIQAVIFKNYDLLLKQRINYQVGRSGYFIESDPAAVKMKQQDVQKRVKEDDKRFQNDIKKRAELQRAYFQKQTYILEPNRLITTINNEIPIQFFQNFIVQSKDRWDQLNMRIKLRIDQIKLNYLTEKKKGFMQQFMKIFKKQNEPLTYHQNSLNKIRQIVQTCFLLNQYWFESPEKNYPYRIICVDKRDSVDKRHFYIYMQQYKTGFNTAPLSQEHAINLSNKLTFLKFAIKNQQRALRLQQIYEGKTKKVMGQKIIFQNSKLDFLVPQKIQLKQQSFTNMQNLGKNYSKQLVERWKLKSRQIHQTSKTYLFIQPQCIYITKKILPNNVSLIINNGQFRQNYLFSFQNQNFFVFQPEEYIKKNLANKKTYSFDQQNFQRKYIDFSVFINEQNGKQLRLKNNVYFSNIQNGLGFQYYLGLLPQAKEIMTFDNKKQYPYILQIQALIKKSTAYQIPQSIKYLRKSNLLYRLGQIPTIYQTVQYYKYTPEIHPIISQIFNGVPSPVTQRNFQNTYLKFADFSQRQESKSQNYCQLVHIRRGNSLQSTGFVMRERYNNYSLILKDYLQYVNQSYNPIANSSFNSPVLSRQLVKKNLKNNNDDFFVSKYRMIEIQSILQRYIIYHHIQAKNTKNLTAWRMSSTQSVLKIAIKVVQIYQRRAGNMQNQDNRFDINQVTKFFIAFMMALYPYDNNLSSLKEELLQIRILTQKYIPQFSYLLNRKGIGLQNYVSNLLLRFFTTLPMELCYRIWDHLLANLHRAKQIRIATIFTILLYQQKSNMTPIYPINQIIQSININNAKFKLDQSVYFNMKKVLDNNNIALFNKHGHIVQLAQQKYLRKFVFGKTRNKQQRLDEQNFQRHNNKKIEIPSSQRIQAKLMSVEQLPYPLPTPGYNGYPVQKLCLFISEISLLGNFDLHTNAYKLQISLLQNSQIKDVQIRDKSVFINKYLELNFYDPNAQLKTPPILQFTVIQSSPTEPNAQIMFGRVRLDNFHKDLVHKQHVILTHNKKFFQKIASVGSSIVTIAFCLKSNYKKVQIQNYDDRYYTQTQFLQKFLNFDLSPQNNEVIRQMNKLDDLMRKIIDPLDQLDAQKYLRLRISTSFRPFQAQWIRNSKVSVEQLKAIFSHIFSQEKEKDIRLNLPIYYKNYAQNYQKFDYGRFLLQLILMSSISKKNKLAMIFCVACHYQNVYQRGTSQKLTIQTVNSIITQIYKSTGFINACPFVQQFYGEIVYGCYYQKGNKVQENKKQITQILQDWAYICKLKSHYGGIILGSINDLALMKAMLPTNVLKKIQTQLYCRFQIHYKIKGEIFIWSTTVNTSDFSIARRGVKFLNSYPKYAQVKGYLTAIGDTLYNCENLIPLQYHGTFTYQQFQSLFSQSPFLDYALVFNQYMTQGRNEKQINQIQQYKMTQYQLAPRLSLQKIITTQLNQIEGGKTDFAVFRHQNCIPSWRKCRIKDNQTENLIQVEFLDRQKLLYLVPKYQVINMEQSLPQLDGQHQITQSDLSEHTKYNKIN